MSTHTIVLSTLVMPVGCVKIQMKLSNATNRLPRPFRKAFTKVAIVG